MSRLSTLLVCGLFLAVGCSVEPTPHGHGSVAGAPAMVPPLFEAVYREDLRRNPENGWSLFGLAQSLRAQGKSADAASVDQRFRRAWARADGALTSSRF